MFQLCHKQFFSPWWPIFAKIFRLGRGVRLLPPTASRPRGTAWEVPNTPPPPGQVVECLHVWVSRHLCSEPLNGFSNFWRWLMQKVSKTLENTNKGNYYCFYSFLLSAGTNCTAWPFLKVFTREAKCFFEISRKLCKKNQILQILANFWGFFWFFCLLLGSEKIRIPDQIFLLHLFLWNFWLFRIFWPYNIFLRL